MRAASAATVAFRQLAGLVRGRAVLSSIVIQPTLRCNLRCVYCSAPYTAGDELDTTGWRAIVSEAAALGCRRVAIHGGEPLIRRDIAQLIGAVRENGMTCTLTSNGLLVPHSIEALKGLDTLVLSLDAPGARNDGVRGEGVFDKVCAEIDAARAAGIPTKLNAVLSAGTVSDLDELLTFAEARDFCLTVNIVRSGNATLWHEAAQVKPDDPTIRETLRRLSNSANRNQRLLFSSRTYGFAACWPDYSADRIEKKQVNGVWHDTVSQAPPCHAGQSHLVIASNGDVAPCPLTTDTNTGTNAVRDGLAQAWQSLQGHACVTCFSPCMVEQNYPYSLDAAVLMSFARRHLLRFA